MKEPAWTLRNSACFEMEAKAVGDTMAVGVWQPDPKLRLSTPDVPLQLCYVLDGSFALAMAATGCMLQAVDLIKPGFPPLLLVGLDYVEGKMNARARDYTPKDAVPESLHLLMEKAYPNGVPAELQPGGAELFLRFISDELDPWIRQRYAVANAPAGLLGDSYGGTFANYAFIRQSPVFNKYWLGSPGIFTTPADYAGQFIKTLQGDLVHDTRLFLSVGELEMTGPVDYYRDVGTNCSRMIAALQQLPNDRLQWQSRIYKGHTHTTVFTPAISAALLYLYGPHFPEQ